MKCANTTKAIAARKAIRQETPKYINWNKLCCEVSEKFVKVIDHVIDNGYAKLFFQDLAHSANCKRESCGENQMWQQHLR